MPTPDARNTEAAREERRAIRKIVADYRCFREGKDHTPVAHIIALLHQIDARESRAGR